MMPFPADPNRPPSRQQLATYLDGELDGPACAAVEAWLASHPEAHAQLEAQRRLAQLWQAPEIPEPSEGTWANVLARIEEGIRNQRDKGTRKPDVTGRGRAPRRFWAALITLATAAAILVAVHSFGLLGNYRPGIGSSPAVAEKAEPLPVVEAHEVEIISLDDADSVALVVGEPPVRGPLVLVSVGDVTFENDDHGMETFSTSPADPTAPMILAPQDSRIDSEHNR
jgi:anti-sigma factor RsiW